MICGSSVLSYSSPSDDKCHATTMRYIDVFVIIFIIYIYYSYQTQGVPWYDRFKVCRPTHHSPSVYVRK